MKDATATYATATYARLKQWKLACKENEKPDMAAK